MDVLNLVISGIPSIHVCENVIIPQYVGFKPCYKWNTLNTFTRRQRLI